MVLSWTLRGAKLKVNVKNIDKDVNFSLVKDKQHIYRLIEKADIKAVNLGHKRFVLYLSTNLHRDATKCDGVTYLDEGKIFLEATLDDSRARETLIHEIFHCILHLCGLDDEDEIKIKNEPLTERLTTGLILFMNLNPELTELLYRGQKL